MAELGTVLQISSLQMFQQRRIVVHYIFLGHLSQSLPAATFAGISVSISTFSLVAIAIERYSAICNPLKSRAWQTRSHAYRVIAATWILSLVIMAPYPIFSGLVTFSKANMTTGHMCRLSWPRSQVEQSWWVSRPMWHRWTKDAS